MAIWQADEALCPEAQFLLETGRLVLYTIERDAAGQITDISFNFVARSQLEENYRLCGPEGEG